MSFEALGLPNSLLTTLAIHQYAKPTPIQEKVIPEILDGKDVLAIAKTGSGKTAGYALPILANLDKQVQAKDRNINVLVLVPTRELAEQVKDEFNKFSAKLQNPVKTMAVYGGVSINPQMKNIYGVHVLVATPGRLIDLIDSKALSISKIETLVLDESDKMLTDGFREEMETLVKKMPTKRQNLLFSATHSDKIEEINQWLLKKPALCEVEQEKEAIPTRIDQTAYIIDAEKKGPLLRYLIKSKNMRQVLVFVSSTYQADHVADKLRKNGINAGAMHGKKSQGVRKETLRKFKSGSIPVLVTTDLLARGIDIDFLPFVINYELPRSPKDFIHRIGRTGRVENPGSAITIVVPEDEHHFKIIQKKIKIWIDRVDANEIDLHGF